MSTDEVFDEQSAAASQRPCIKGATVRQRLRIYLPSKRQASERLEELCLETCSPAGRSFNRLKLAQMEMASSPCRSARAICARRPMALRRHLPSALIAAWDVGSSRFTRMAS